MKLTRPLHTTLAIIALSATAALSQDDVPPISEPALLGESALPESPPDPTAFDDEVPPSDNEEPLIQEDQAVVESEDGFLIQDAALNDIFQLLAQKAGKQYFHNINLVGDEYRVTGNLLDRNPEESMDSLAFQFGLQLYRKGETIYALTQDQLNQLPANEWHYQLNYLRPSDIEQIRGLIQPVLTPGTGIVNFEPKTNTIIIIDSPTKIDRARNILEQVDKAKGQIIVEVKILSINQTAAQTLGVNWSQQLGQDAIAPIDFGVNGINSLLGIGPAPLGATALGSDLVLSPDILTGILTALNDGGITTVQDNPVLITEDNEQAIISIIDRIPIIITSQTSNTTGGEPTITEEVRYTIDEADSTDPETTREIGTTIAVTPTALPDNTIRLTMRPRTATITGFVEGITANFPEVRESTVQTTARIPNGHSLIIGGFFQEEEVEEKTKVPLLGDLPLFNFFFKSKESSKIASSLIFVVTPRIYDPLSQNDTHHQRLKSKLSHPKNAAWLDTKHPGNLHEPDLDRTLHNIQHDIGIKKPKKFRLFGRFRK